MEHVIDLGTATLVRSIAVGGTTNFIAVPKDPKTTAVLSLAPSGEIQFLRPPYPGIGRDLIQLLSLNGQYYGAPHINSVQVGDRIDLAMYSPALSHVGGIPYILLTPFFGAAPNPGIFPGVYGLNGPLNTELLHDGSTACGIFGPCSLSSFGLVLPSLTIPAFIPSGLHLLFQGVVVGAQSPSSYASTNAYRLDL